MEVIGNVLTWFFTYILYPGLILCIFLFIGVTIFNIYLRTGSMRTIIAALLPLIMLVFLIVSDHEESRIIERMLLDIPRMYHLVIGAVLGLLLIETGRWTTNSLSPVPNALYCLFLSAVGMFLLFCIMTGAIVSIHTILFGLVLAGGLHAIFRGIPGVAEAEGY